MAARVLKRSSLSGSQMGRNIPPADIVASLTVLSGYFRNGRQMQSVHLVERLVPEDRLTFFFRQTSSLRFLDVIRVLIHERLANIAVGPVAKRWSNQ